MKLKNGKLIVLVIVLTFLFMRNPKNAEALLYNIIETPSTFGFFHEPDWSNYYGNLKLDTSQSNTYAPDTGAFNVSFDIYSSALFTEKIGSAVGIGNLVGDDLNGPYNTLGGSINWHIVATEDSNLRDYLEVLFGPNPNNEYDVEIYYLANNPNAWSEDNGSGTLRLWGEDRHGRYLGNDLKLDGQVVPEPATMILFGSGLLGAFARRRKRS